MAKKKSNSQLVSNRGASFSYEILETFEAGIALQGTEVKSLKEHHGSLQEAYIKTMGSELWLVGCTIPPYRYGNIHNHQERRERKLLMHKHEILRLKAELQERGLALIPLGMYLKQGKIKLQIALGKGKKMHDKRQTIKERDQKRQMQRAKKEHQ
ncbi:MAG: SsrA-binding protein SmpB [Waddliaceae bacterium]